MRPNFALNLSHDGIVLLHRSSRGTWTEVGDVALDDVKFRENLSFLRSTAVGLEGKGFGTKLIIPESQILFSIVDAPGPDPKQRAAQIATALQGLTPYEVADLAYDWRNYGGAIQVAVVARETLDEAEGFAVDHRFNPLSFTSVFADENGIWEPFFGRTDYAVTMLGVDADVRDQAPLADAVEETKPAEEEDAPFTEAEADGEDDEDAIESIFAEDDDPEISPQSGDLTEQPGTDPADMPRPEAENPASETPSFATRRQTDFVSEKDDKARPLDRISSRFLISGEPAKATGTKDSPADEPSGLKALIRVDSSTRVSLKERAKLAIALIKRRLSLISTALQRRLAKRSQPAAPATEPTAFVETQVEPEQIVADVPIESKPSVRVIALARLRTVTAPLSRRPRRVILAAVAGLVVLALFGGLFLTFFSGTNGVFLTDDRDGGRLVNAALTDPADRGIRLNNRAVPRPDDLDISATVSAVANITPAEALANNRPLPRSTFEGGVDPDAGQPDTVSPLTELSAQELADIRAAGLASPTEEEMAEGADPVVVLPAIPESELASLYAESGILQGTSVLATPRVEGFRDAIYVAALDRELDLNDAIALPAILNSRPDLPVPPMVSPLGPDVTFDLDERGLVIATTKGALAPSGVLIFKGKPEIIPPPKPIREILNPISDLAGIRPVGRPTELKTGVDAVFVQGRLTRPQLQRRAPKPRPLSEQQQLAGDDTTPTKLAVLVSRKPSGRPGDFAATVTKTQTLLAAANATAEPGVKPGPVFESGPVIPTRASVAKLATTKNAIDHGRLNLIGVYGTPSQRRALLRLPSGLYVKVEIGDRIDGGRVASIGVDSLNYVKSGRNRVLTIPN